MSLQAVPSGHVTTPEGFLAASTAAGIKTRAGAHDLAILASDRDCAAGGVFTTNLVRSAPVDISEARTQTGRLRAIVVNSGNANALNGAGGTRDAIAMAAAAAAHIGVAPEAVAVASTGVTGVPLPLDKVTAGIPHLALTREGGPDFARAIMTTDTMPKEVAYRVTSPAGSYAIGGCCKGSGMIHPNMATMLAYITTDAAVEPGFLQEVVRETADATFNMVTVDGDTSCSDTFIALANGAAGLPRIERDSPEAAEFRAGMLAVGTHLARVLARDGEGAEHLLEVVVRNALSVGEARLIAKTVALSSLVKTAVAGRDPNWGRILVAAGRSGAKIDPAVCSMWMQGECLYEKGSIVPFVESVMREKLAAEEVNITIDVALGDAGATAWGCDLTTEYVHINADYRT